MFRITWNIFVVLIVAYMGLVATLFVTQRGMQYAPDPADPSPAATKVPEMQEMDVVVPGEGRNESWYHFNPNADRTVIFFHGNASNVSGRDTKARVLIDAGFNVVLAGYRGYGGNRGKPTENGLYNDARAVVNEMIKERGFRESSLVFYGESLGSGVAVKMASEFPHIAGLILDVPFDSALAVAQEKYWYVVGLSALMKDHYRSDQLIGKLTMPKLFLVAGQDRVVPPSHAKRLFKRAPEPKKMMVYARAGHSDVYDHGAGQDVAAFIANIILAQDGE